MQESLRKKLQFKQATKVAVLHAPSDFQHDELVQIQEDTTGLLAFVRFSKQMDSEILLKKAQAVVWVAYPKKASGISTDLSQMIGWSLFEKQDWLPVRQVAIDANWSALRFRPKSEIKKLTRNTDYLGINRETKTVQIPEDFKQAMQKSNVLNKFESLAFSYRKEYVISILDAKKPETRARRIQKNVEQMLTL